MSWLKMFGFVIGGLIWFGMIFVVGALAGGAFSAGYAALGLGLLILDLVLFASLVTTVSYWLNK